MLWDDLDRELERQRWERDQRLEQIGRELRERIEKVERRCKESEEARRAQWEQIEGRVMTADEKQERRSDEFLRLANALALEHLKMIGDLSDDMTRRSEESREENRAQSEALLKMLDRLPPA
ncbi:MAG TPA: hypothetical protein VFX35_03370 [Solirubrobacterales bacterium]|nr:hypothetical protein [Solirubrobacterales bacterium]